ncbi:FkbM family methyltransferase [Rhizobium sp. BK176]|uniref:FkbM family methyltransferase n=1 Tax=Rhizobium sp. BK176 TaxID=2587071 RepID=UPI0021671BF7|nr:FkbM family methyltransferase [Rhizobium sp. BK176]MCS4091843.1 FkbM family methyltransferase [Rhizobium sp. BK176]
MKFYGQFDPPVDRFLFERYFPDVNIKGVFVECGAFDGAIDSSCRFFEEAAGWSGYNIEAVPYLFQKLVANRPNSKNLQIALSGESGSTTFRHAVHPSLGQDFGNGSISHSESHIQELIDRNCTFEEFTVETLTWRDFVARENIRHVDLFVLDVEGHELSVLEGMKGTSILPSVMCVEFGHIDLTVLVSAMASLGYHYDIHSWANAYFIRADMLSLFAFRRAALVHEDTIPKAQYEALGKDHQLLVTQYEALGRERDWLIAREAELVRVIKALENSKIMRMAKAIKKLVGKS